MRTGRGESGGEGARRRPAYDRGFALLPGKSPIKMSRLVKVPKPKSIMRKSLSKVVARAKKSPVLLVGLIIIVIIIAVGVPMLMKRTRKDVAPAPVEQGDATPGAFAADRPAIADALDLLNGEVVEKTRDYFYPARSIVETTARMLSQYSSVRDGFFERYCLDVLAKVGKIDHFYIADADGNRVIASRSREPGISAGSDVIDRTGAEPVRVVKRWDKTGSMVSVKTFKTKQLLDNPTLGGLNAGRTSMYDPRERPWYKRAAKRLTTCWSDVYIFSVDSVPGITVASPAVGPSGELLFVVAADFEIETISRFVAELKVGREGIAFIVNDAGDLVAHPVPEKVLKKEDGKLAFAKASDVVPEWAKAALDIHEKNQQKVFSFAHRGSRYVASFAAFPESFGTDWTMVVVASEGDLLGAATGRRDRNSGP